VEEASACGPVDSPKRKNINCVAGAHIRRDARFSDLKPNFAHGAFHPDFKERDGAESIRPIMPTEGQLSAVCVSKAVIPLPAIIGHGKCALL
jgi:hypothetical protein